MASSDKAKSQRDRFVETARELEADESEDRFNETLRRVVKQPTHPTRNAPPDEDG